MMSFPWIFDKELGKIAGGKGRQRDELILRRGIQPGRHGQRNLAGPQSGEGTVFLGKGPVHCGEVLKLFHDASSGASDTGWDLNGLPNPPRAERSITSSPESALRTQDGLVVNPLETALPLLEASLTSVVRQASPALVDRPFNFAGDDLISFEDDNEDSEVEEQVVIHQDDQPTSFDRLQALNKH
jgi:hypothetical protein